MPELPEVEITVRLLDEALRGEIIESALSPSVNALKTFDPPLHALEGRTIEGIRRRGKLVLIDVSGELTVLLHLMSAGRLQLYPKRATLRDRTSRLLLRLSGDRELRLREFGTRQAAWVKVYAREALEGEEHLSTLGPEAWPDPPAPAVLAERLGSSRPLHPMLRDQRVIAGIGRTWVDDILWCARLSPFKRGDDLSEEEVATLRDAIVSELGRAVDAYAGDLDAPAPRQAAEGRADPRPTRASPARAARRRSRRSSTRDYVMTYCPKDQTEGRVLKDRRLSRCSSSGPQRVELGSAEETSECSGVSPARGPAVVLGRTAPPRRLGDEPARGQPADG
jgi:formamidopyrimidine-DNA glycosylase